jgi:hypothetical protein
VSRDDPEETVELKLDVLAFSDGDTTCWLPARMIALEVHARGTTEITMPVWLAKDRGLV